MNDAWHIIRVALRDTWNDLLTTALVNLLWLVLTLLVVTAPPATLALFYTANRIAHGEPTDTGDFLRAVRRFFGTGWRWGLVNGALIFILIADAFLTGRLSQSPGAHLAQGLYLAALGVWLLLQLYVLPFLCEQESPGLRLALRNGAVMMGANIRFSVALGILLLIALLVGTAFFLVTVAAGGVFLALVANHAVLNRLATHQAAQKGQEP